MSVHLGSEDFLAAGGVTLVGISPSSDPARGSSWTHSYTGTRTGIALLEANFRLQRIRFSASYSGGSGSLQAFYGNDPENPALEAPEDDYSRGNDVAQASVFENPALWSFLNSNGNPGEAKRALLAAAESDVVDSSIPISTFAQSVVFSLARGVDTYWVLLPTFRRSREYSIGYGGARRAPVTYPVAYTRTALIRDFAIPAAIAEELIPADPEGPVPDLTRFAWRISTDDAETLGGRSRIRETIIWTSGFIYPTQTLLIE